ncbi:hypothetical protein [Pseudomonas anguilliseptica]|uniref:hypothetical protein n=1 Tax=Pseudomonas anguilliseptica TaxID=53406 RepID=UPI00325B9B08
MELAGDTLTLNSVGRLGGQEATDDGIDEGAGLIGITKLREYIELDGRTETKIIMAIHQAALSSKGSISAGQSRRGPTISEEEWQSGQTAK